MISRGKSAPWMQFNKWLPEKAQGKTAYFVDGHKPFEDYLNSVLDLWQNTPFAEKVLEGQNNEK